jgi:hypothetical protein
MKKKLMEVSMKTSFVLILIVSSLLGCTSQKLKNELKSEVSTVKDIKNENDLLISENQFINQNQKLNEGQKVNLQSLMAKTSETNKLIDSEILKTKSVLFKSLVSTDNNKYKIKVLEGQLLKLNKKRIRNTLNAYKEAKVIVGKSDVSLEKTLEYIDRRSVHDF